MKNSIITQVKKLSFIFVLLSAFISLSGYNFLTAEANAQGVEKFKTAGKFLIGAKVLHLFTDEDSTVSIGGEAKVGDDTIPLLEFRYFFTDNIAIDTILGTTKHNADAIGTALGDIDLGSVRVIPSTLTLQYHFNSSNNFLPYVGAGINYTFFYHADPGAVANVTYHDNVGFAINFGFDYVLSENNYFNIDFKKYSLSTDVFVDAGAAGTATAKVDIDPLAVSIGYGWRF